MSALVLGTTVSLAATSVDKVETSNMVDFGSPVIFVEDGITFSVYPDGELDFYIDNRVNAGANVSIGNSSITFNSGYNYDPYVQYDDFGAVIQVENVPIYYDYYGRVSQIGNIDIWYGNGRLNRIGGLHLYYNRGGVFTHYSGYVNVYNRHYVFRPYHRYFVRPAVSFCLVYNRPYRRYYHPVRYTYYRPYVRNYRKAYAKVGHSYKYNKGNRRGEIYRNDNRVAVRENSRRSTDYRSSRNTPVRKEAIGSARSSLKRNDTGVKRNTQARNTQTATARTPSSTPDRRSSGNRNVTRTDRSNAKAPAVQKNEAQRTKAAPASRERSVTTRTVIKTPASRTVKRSTTVKREVKAPARSERSARTSAPVKRNSTYSRGTTTKRSAAKPAVRASRSNQGAKARSSSRRIQ
jgi:hypothetical protein